MRYQNQSNGVLELSASNSEGALRSKHEQHEDISYISKLIEVVWYFLPISVGSEHSLRLCPSIEKSFQCLAESIINQYVANQFYKLFDLDAMIFLPLLLLILYDNY